jgi:hypothetical protein
LPIPPLTNWRDETSTEYWSCGGGLLSEPLEFDSGTLNWITLEPDAQWPAVPKHPHTSSMMYAVQPTGSARALKGSVESTRSSTPQIDSCVSGSISVSPIVARSTATRLTPVPGCETSSTSTASPLK